MKTNNVEVRFVMCVACLRFITSRATKVYNATKVSTSIQRTQHNHSFYRKNHLSMDDLLQDFCSNLCPFPTHAASSPTLAITGVLIFKI